MEQYGNATTYNIERVLYQNAADSEYFKNKCAPLATFEELVDEVGEALSFRHPFIPPSLATSVPFSPSTRLRGSLISVPVASTTAQRHCGRQTLICFGGKTWFPFPRVHSQPSSDLYRHR